MADLGIRVTPEQLEALSQRVGGSSRQIEGELASLRTMLAPLGSDWAGAASAQFAQLWREWETGAAKIHDALTGISALLGQAGRAYASAEAQIAKSFVAM